METFNFEMTAGQLNQTYEKIKNCRVIQPPYDIDGFYSGEFYLDKRLGLELLLEDTSKTFLDSIDISGITYYYYISTNQGVTKGYIGTYENQAFVCVTPNGFIVSKNSPKRIARGRGPIGPSGGSITIGNSVTKTNNPVFKCNYSGTSVQQGDYIMFNNTDQTLVGVVAQNLLVYGIDHPENNGYIGFATDDAKTVPQEGDTAIVFSEADCSIGFTIMIGHTNENGAGIVSSVIVNGIQQATVVQVFKFNDNEVLDVVEFSGSLFYMTAYYIFYTSSLVFSNTHYLVSQKYKIDAGYKLFPIGDGLLAFGNQNKIIAPVVVTGGSEGSTTQFYIYNINYNGDLFGKYSTIFTDQTIYIVQSDKQLMQVDVKKVNMTTYEIIVKNALLNTRGIFDKINKNGELFIHSSQGSLNFLYQENGNTINYQFNKQYQHWIIQEYIGRTIYKIEDEGMALAQGGIYSESALVYTDNGDEYDQDVNMLIVGGLKMYMPLIIRTMFGIKIGDEILPKVDLDLIMGFEIGGKTKGVRRKISNYDFDSRLNTTVFTGDQLIGYDKENEEVSQYNGTVVSIQSTILKTGRFIRFKYNGFNRFCIGPSYVLADYTKPFINEINKAN